MKGGVAVTKLNSLLEELKGLDLDLYKKDFPINIKILIARALE